MYFEISRAYVAGKQMTVAQRTSSLFSEEPTVLGKALRRGLPPLKINERQFAQAEHTLKRLFDAGAINIKAVHGNRVVDFRERDAQAKIAASMPAASDELKEMLDPDPDAEKKAIIEQHEADRKLEQVAAGDSQPPMQEEQTGTHAPPAEVPSFDDKTEVVHTPPPPPEKPHPTSKKKGR